MDRAIRVKRYADAMKSIEEKAAILAERAGAEDEYQALLDAKRVRDDPTSQTLQLEALNDLLEKAIQAQPAEMASAQADAERTLEDIDGIGPELADNLREAGLQSPGDLRQASDEDLLAVDGVGEGKLKKIRANL